MATVIAPECLITAEEYGKLPSNGVPSELIRGRIVEMNIPFSRHGAICSNIDFALRLYLLDHDVGRVMCNDAAVRTERGPDTVRGADVAFISYNRRAKGPIPPHSYIDRRTKI